MEIEFDLAKNEANIILLGLSFEMAVHFDFDDALILVDGRHNYGKVRPSG